MKLPFNEIEKDNKLFRIFSESTNSEEFKWHRDKENRIVKPIHKTDWLIQLDNELPKSINEDIFIPKGVYHRLIKGTGDLKIELVKLNEELNLVKKEWTEIDLNDIDDDTINFMWNTYTSEYKRLGMDLSVNNVNEFRRSYKAVLLIDLDKDPNPDAFIIFTTNLYGNKINLLWTDGKKESKRFIVKKLIELLKTIGWWVEASLKLEDILKDSNVNYIESTDDIKRLIPKDFIYLSDGYYSRKLSIINKWITKRIYGNPKL